MLTNEQRDQRLEELKAARVTPEHIEAQILAMGYWRPFADSTTTICCLKLKNGFEVVGKSACAHPENFDADLGKKIAFDDAFKQVWPLEGYLLRNKIWEAHQAAQIPAETPVPGEAPTAEEVQAEPVDSVPAAEPTPPQTIEAEAQPATAQTAPSPEPVTPATEQAPAGEVEQPGVQSQVA